MYMYTCSIVTVALKYLGSSKYGHAQIMSGKETREVVINNTIKHVSTMQVLCPAAIRDVIHSYIIIIKLLM